MNRTISHPLLARRAAVLAMAAGTLSAATSAWADVPAGDARAKLLALEAAYLDAWNRHDADAIAAVFSPDGMRWTPSNQAGLVGPAAIAADARNLFAIYPDFHVDVQRVEVIDEQRLVKQFVFKGTWSGRFTAGPLAERTPSGRPFATPAIERLELRDGRILSSRTFFDRLSLLAQIGALGPG